jgi:hypothetical protein
MNAPESSSYSPSPLVNFATKLKSCDMLTDMSTRGTPFPNTTGAGPYKRKLEELGFTLVVWPPATKPGGKEAANLQAPKSFHVCILDKDDYIAVTKLRSCTGLALYDPASKLGAMYHFGGQFNNEEAELREFAAQLSAHNVELGKLQMWLFGSTKCGFADKLLKELRALLFTQTPSVMQIDGQANPEAAFYLLGTGVAAHQLT